MNELTPDPSSLSSTAVSGGPADDLRRDVPRIAFGLVLVAFGLLLLSRNFGLPDLDIRLGMLWPLVFFYIGLVKVMRRNDWPGAVFFAFLGVVFFLPVFRSDVRYEDIFEQWPLFVVALGLMLVMRSIFPPEPVRRGAKRAARAASGLVAFRTEDVRPHDEAYRGQSLTALLGGAKLDLTDCTLHGDGAVIDLFGWWAGIEIRVPRDWQVDLRVVPIMGGTDDKTRQNDPPDGEAPRLTIRGVVMMAGLEVRN